MALVHVGGHSDFPPCSVQYHFNSRLLVSEMNNFTANLGTRDLTSISI